MTTFQAAPFAGRMMADWGADVIKVESLSGDTYRTYGHAARIPCTEDENPYWDAANTNKRAVSIDIKHLGGIAVQHPADA